MSSRPSSPDADALSRRQVILLGSASVVGAMLPGCDRLVLPADELIDEIPAITSNESFYRYSYNGTPTFDASTWSVSIRDRGVEVATFDQSTLDTLVPEAFEHTLQCIGSGPRTQNIGNAIWGGVPLADVLDDLGVTIDPSIVDIALRGADDYHDAVPVEDLDKPVWLVWEMNGEPLPLAHGAPARLIVPNRYGIKNVKWLTVLDFVDAPYRGYWQQQGWSPDGSYQPNVFIKSPPAVVDVGRDTAVLFIGTAHGGGDPITKVEITFDDGETWETATIDYQPGPNRWTLWSFEWIPVTRGNFAVRTRGTTEGGRVTGVPAGSNPSAGYDGGMEIEVRVV